jgi:hypothetical protein
MKLDRATHNPGELLEFYEEGLTALGALCERTWHDRLEVVAEGRAGKLWNPSGILHEVELHFLPADAVSARDAAREVFPGCPLTFQLADALRPSPLPLERFILADATPPRAPDAAMLEKLWRVQFPDTTRWQLAAPLKQDYSFTLLASVRCEIQAIDQRWSTHRIALSLPGGEADDSLGREIAFHQAGGAPEGDLDWPAANPLKWRELLQQALEQELAEELERVRARQENSLRRELERIDDYFEKYEDELLGRSQRTSNEISRLKMADRLAAAKAEHARRRADQMARHEIHVCPHVDMLLLVAEKAWRAQLRADRARQTHTTDALFVPRSRRWSVAG